LDILTPKKANVKSFFLFFAAGAGKSAFAALRGGKKRPSALEKAAFS